MSDTARRLATASILALGLWIVWIVVVTWAFSSIEPLFRIAGYREQIAVAPDGTPLIVGRTAGRRDQRVMTLDRRPIEGLEGRAGPLSLAGTKRPPGLWPEPIPWRNRVTSQSNHTRPFATWFVIRDGERPGRAYAVAYDADAKRPVAYASRRGVAPNLPPREDWFDFGLEVIDYNQYGPVVSNAYLTPGNAEPGHFVRADDDRNVRPWTMFLKDGDRVVKLDLRAETVKTLARVDGLRQPPRAKAAERDDPRS